MGDRPFKPLALFQSRFGKWLGARMRAQQFRASFYSPIFDPLKRRIFFLPVRWHARELNEKWTAVEREALNELSRWVKPPDEDRRLESSGTEIFFRKLGEPFLNFGLALVRWLGTYLVHRRDYQAPTCYKRLRARRYVCHSTDYMEPAPRIPCAERPIAYGQAAATQQLSDHDSHGRKKKTCDLRPGLSGL